MSNDTGYPDPQDINTGSPGNSDSDNPSDTEQESISTSQQETSTPKSVNSGFLDIPQGNQDSGGIDKDDLDVMPSAPVLDEFFKKDNRGRPPKVRFKNTARVRVTHHNQDPKIRGDTNIIDEFSSQRRAGCSS